MKTDCDVVVTGMGVVSPVGIGCEDFFSALMAGKSGVSVVDALPLHRVEYLQYEGPVSGDRGIVQRVMAGDYELVSPDEASFLNGGFDAAKIRLSPQNILLRLQRESGDRFRLNVFFESTQALD